MVATSFGRYFGFGSRMSGFVDEILVAMYGGYSLSFCQGPDKFMERLWNRSFENPARVSFCKSRRHSCGRHLWNGLHTGSFLSEELSKFDERYVADLKRFIYPTFFKYNAETEAVINKTLASAGLSAGARYLAMHIRRGDKIGTEAKYLHTKEYTSVSQKYIAFHGAAASMMKVVQRELLSRGLDTVYVASDDEETKDQIRTQLGHDVRLVFQPHPTGVTSRGYEKREDFVSLLADIEALRRSDVFIGTASSNIGRLVYFLRPKERTSISMDDSWLKRHA